MALEFTDFEDAPILRRSLSDTVLRKKTPEELEREQAEQALAQQAKDQEQALESARTGAADELAKSQAASKAAADDIERKQAESRAAAESTRLSAQLLRDNTKTDLTSSGDPLLIAGGSADAQGIDDSVVKKKLKGSGIAAQVGINV